MCIRKIDDRLLKDFPGGNDHNLPAVGLKLNGTKIYPDYGSIVAVGFYKISDHNVDHHQSMALSLADNKKNNNSVNQESDNKKQDS